MTSRIAALCVDARAPRELARFWCRVLDWEIVEEEAGGVGIGPRGSTVPEIDFLPVPESKEIKNRLHLDLRADGSTTAEERDRLLALGAVPAGVGQPADAPWTVLTDIEGNEFCLLHTSVQELARALQER